MKLTYHPAFDIYHGAFRLLLLTERGSEMAAEVERIRIWDFYFVFPDETRKVSFPRDLWSLRSGFQFQENPYEVLIDPKMVFDKMLPFQMSAIRYLVARGFFDSDELKNNKLLRTEKMIPSKLVSRMENLTYQQQYIIRLIESPLNDLSLYGESGLKARTKLLDYKYDVA